MAGTSNCQGHPTGNRAKKKAKGEDGGRLSLLDIFKYIPPEVNRVLGMIWGCIWVSPRMLARQHQDD